MMDMTSKRLYREALDLPDDSKVWLAERLVEYLETNMPAELQRQHLDIVNRRREQILSGQVKPVDGPEALQKARGMLRK